LRKAKLSIGQEDRIRFYITDHYFTNDKRKNDNYLPLIGGGDISKAISKYFDEHYNTLVNGIEAFMKLSYEDAIHELSEEPNKVELVKMVKQILGNTSTYEQRCISVDGFKDGIKIRCNGGHDVAVMVNEKLTKAGLKQTCRTTAGLLQCILSNHNITIMDNELNEAGIKPNSITVGLIPTKITANWTLDEFVEQVKARQKEFNATDKMSIVAIVTFTVIDFA